MMNLHPVAAIKSIILWMVGTITNVAVFFKEAIQETTEYGFKASFGRITGSYVIWKIVDIADRGSVIDENLMTLFYWLVGYSLLSKLAPPILEVVKQFIVKGLPASYPIEKRNADNSAGEQKPTLS